jgi:transcriptional regulator with XRE-family HTH domain
VARELDIRQVFQERLKAMRIKRELSQRDLGILAGLDPFVASTRVNRYELGVHQPDLATAQRLADSLKVPLAYLFAADDRLARAIVAFDQLPAREKDRFLAALETDGT